LRAGREERAGSRREASERILTYGVHVAVLFTNIQGIRSLAIIGMTSSERLALRAPCIYQLYSYLSRGYLINNIMGLRRRDFC